MKQVTPEVAEKYRRVIELRKAALTFEQIAEEVGYAARSGAKRALDAAFDRWGGESIQSMRLVQNERLDDLFRRIYLAIVNGDLAQVDRALRIEKRRAELFGLDAPKQHEITGVEGGPLRTDVGDMLIARLEELRRRQGPLVTDADMAPLALTNGSEHGTENGSAPPMPSCLSDIYPDENQPDVESDD